MFPSSGLSGREFPFRLATGRTASGPRKSARHVWIWLGRRSKTTVSERTNSSIGALTAGVEPMLAVNLGTGRPKGCREFNRILQFSRRTPLQRSQEKIRASRTPRRKYWVPGNEMGRPWADLPLDAEDYGGMPWRRPKSCGLD